MDDLIERLHGPHEWGYRDPVEGGFVADDAPYQSADRITALEAENARLREEGDKMSAALIVVRDLPIIENDGPDTLHINGESFTGPPVDFFFRIVRKLKRVADNALKNKDNSNG